MKTSSLALIALLSACGFPEPTRLHDGGMDGQPDAGGPTLTIVAENKGIGSGLVTYSPPGAVCSNNTCTHTYADGAQVDLVATTGANSRFVGWTGDCDGLGACSLTMDGPKQVGAQFSAYQLMVNVTGTGSVGISNPSATCPSACTQVYSTQGATVTLTPQPGASQAFGGWTGDCSGVGPCTLVMDENRTVGGSFGTAAALTVTLAGGGQGTVTSADEGIDCGTDCAQDYVTDSLVLLTAVPEQGHVFGGFSPSGICESMTADTCSVRMSAAKNVTATFSVVGIDLIITSMVCTPNSFGGGSVTCTPVVKNIGDTAAGASTVALWLSQNATLETNIDRSENSCGVNALAAGASQSVTGCSFTFSTGGSQSIYGPAYVLAVADANNAVIEASENNNIKATPVNVTTTGRELVVSSLSCTPSAVAAPGRDVSCTATVFNAGDQATSMTQPMQTDMLMWTTYPGGSQTNIGTCTAVSAPIPAQSSVMITCTGTIPAATPTGVTRYVGVDVDSTNRVGERQENNNTAAVSMFIGIPNSIDLRISSMTCPSAAAPSDMVSCTVTVQNIGEKPATPFAVDVRLSADTTIDATDTLLGNCAVPASLAPGQSYSLSCGGQIPASATVSVSRLGAIADSANAVMEADETNNTASQPLTIGPDVVVQSVSCPAAIAKNTTLTCTVVLRNQGSQPTVAFASQLRWSTDTTIDTTDTLLGSCNALSIAAGATQSISCSGTVPAVLATATYRAGIIADSANVVAEAVETNNTNSAAVGIGPNITFGGGWTCPSTITRSQPVTCSGPVVNSGVDTTGAGFADTLRVQATPFSNTATDVLVTTCSLGALAGSGTVTLNCSGTVPATAAVGGQYLVINLDSGGAITEFNEGDNLTYFYVTVQ